MILFLNIVLFYYGFFPFDLTDGICDMPSILHKTKGGDMMDANQIMETEEFKRCTAFHGHVCPGLSLGYKAALAAMENLQAQRSEDEEIVAIVENDACFVDAVQVLTGCTFGKGNLIFKDHGKLALTLFSRNTGKGIRVAVLPDALKPDKNQSTREPGPADRQKQMIHKILEAPPEQIFKIQAIQTSLPEKAVIHGSEPCAICGELTMKTKLEMKNAQKLCRDCLAKI
jgi:formylmethanofuran dehydrogenase subunit E